MKKVLFISMFSAFMLIIASCGGSKAVQGDVRIEVPCSGPEYRTNNEYFRASAVGLSSDMNIARQKAMTEARTVLAQAIEVKVSAVTDNYSSSYQMGEDEEARSRFQQLSRQAVQQQLSGIRVLCEETMKSPEGKYKVYVAIELSGEDIMKAAANRISEDEKLRTDFEYEKFKKVFEEEMSKF